MRNVGRVRRSRHPANKRHSTVLPHPCHQRFRAVDAVGNQNQRFAERDRVAQAFVAHGLVLDAVDIRDVGKPDAAANEFGAAEPDGIMPDFFQERGSIAWRAERCVARFLVSQRLEAFREDVPQLLNIGQALLARGGGIANAEMAR